MRQTALVASLTTPPSTSGGEIAALGPAVEVLEVRADLVGDLDPDWLRDRFGGRLIYTLRSQAEGGAFEGGKNRRRRRLAAAAARYDLVDLEADRDLFPELLLEVPEERRLISWHGAATHLTALKNRFERLAATPAKLYKMIPAASQAGDALKPLALLQSLRRDDVVAFASGAGGAWTRPLAPRLGSPLVYGSLGEVPAAPGQMTVERLQTDFGLPQLPEARQLFGIVGRPVAHSRSPRLHNGAYRALGIPALYLPFHADSFGDFWLDVVEAAGLEALGLPLRGLSVTAPFKEVALAVAGASSPLAQRISAANTLVVSEGVWEAETTDPKGVTASLVHAGVELRDAAAAVVGCGGAGKAAAVGLDLAGAAVTLVNRGEERGRRASAELGLPFVPLADFDPGGFPVVVHATELGHRDEDESPFDPDRLSPEAVVLDMVYRDGPTRLLRRAAARGCRTVDGLEVLLQQAFGQFRRMTGRQLNEALARQLLGLAEVAER